MLQGLLIALAKVKLENTSQKVLNKISKESIFCVDKTKSQTSM